MAKNLQEYLDKHKGCEVYKGQDKGDAEQEQDPFKNPMEMVLSEEGEKTFYYAARNSTQPLSIPTPDNAGQFPAPPQYVPGAGRDSLAPGASTQMLATQASSLVGSLTTASVAVPIPAGSPPATGMDESDMGSFNSMIWGTPPADGGGAASAAQNLSPMMSPQYGGRVEPGSLNPGMALPGHSTGGFTFGALAPTLGSELPAGAVMRAGGFGPPGEIVGGAETAALHQFGGNRSLPVSGHSLDGAMPRSYKGEPIMGTTPVDSMDTMEL